MSKAGHTPGPWEHCLDDDPPDPEIETADGWCVAHVQCHGNINTVTRTGEEFSHADARLIAAAPDLLEALESAVAQYGKQGGPWNVPSDPGGWLMRSRDAIAKATGKIDKTSL